MDLGDSLLNLINLLISSILEAKFGDKAKCPAFVHRYSIKNLSKNFRKIYRKTPKTLLNKNTVLQLNKKRLNFVNFIRGAFL